MKNVILKKWTIWNYCSQFLVLFFKKYFLFIDILKITEAQLDTFVHRFFFILVKYSLNSKCP